MSTKQNPFLQQIISSIATKANDGRMNDISWATLNEAKKSKKNIIKLEAAKKGEEPAVEEPAAEEPKSPEAAPAAAPAEPSTAPAEAPAKEPAPEETPAAPDAGTDDSDVEQAQADAVAKKAELEKAKAEKDQAEQELKKNTYIKLNSQGGINFLLGKVLDHAFKTDSIDALAGELVQKLKIQTPEDLQAFSEELAPYKVLPGIGELLTSMKSMATKSKPEEDETEPKA